MLIVHNLCKTLLGRVCLSFAACPVNLFDHWTQRKWCDFGLRQRKRNEQIFHHLSQEWRSYHQHECTWGGSYRACVRHKLILGGEGKRSEYQHDSCDCARHWKESRRKSIGPWWFLLWLICSFQHIQIFRSHRQIEEWEIGLLLYYQLFIGRELGLFGRWVSHKLLPSKG